MKLFKKAKKGFTLVELVVVIAVIAILAAVSVGAYFGVTESAKQSKADQEAKQLHTALMLIVNTPDNKDAAAWSNDNKFDVVNEKKLEAAILAQVSYPINVVIQGSPATDGTKPTGWAAEGGAVVTFNADPAEKFTYTVDGKSATLNIKTGAADTAFLA